MNKPSNCSDKPAVADERGEALLAVAVAQQPTGDAHPDEDSLAAWHEDRLDAIAASRVEQHVAHCDRCFAVWNGLLALEPQDEAAQSKAAGRRRRLFAEPAALRAIAGLAATVVVAVALSVLVMEPRRAPMPGYSLSLEGNTRYYRDAASAEPLPAVVFESGNRFRLILTPQTAYDEQVSAALYTIVTDGAVRSLATPPAQLSDSGALRINAVVGDGISLPTGPVDLLIVVGMTGSMPRAAEVVARLDAGDNIAERDWQAWRIPIQPSAP